MACLDGISSVLCTACGELAHGFAEIDGRRYCHCSCKPSCFMAVDWETETPLRFRMLDGSMAERRTTPRRMGF